MKAQKRVLKSSDLIIIIIIVIFFVTIFVLFFFSHKSLQQRVGSTVKSKSPLLYSWCRHRRRRCRCYRCCDGHYIIIYKMKSYAI